MIDYVLNELQKIELITKDLKTALEVHEIKHNSTDIVEIILSVTNLRKDMEKNDRRIKFNNI